jgi:hypothetical protein
MSLCQGFTLPATELTICQPGLKSVWFDAVNQHGKRLTALTTALSYAGVISHHVCCAITRL